MTRESVVEKMIMILHRVLTKLMGQKSLRSYISLYRGMCHVEPFKV